MPALVDSQIARVQFVPLASVLQDASTFLSRACDFATQTASWQALVGAQGSHTLLRAADRKKRIHKGCNSLKTKLRTYAS